MGHAAKTVDIRSAYKILFGKSRRIKLFGRPKGGREGDIKINI